MSSPVTTPDGRRVATPVTASSYDNDDDDDGPPGLVSDSNSDRDSERPTLRGAESGSDTEVEEAPANTRSSRILSLSQLRNLDAQFGRPGRPVMNFQAGPWMSSAFHRIAAAAGREMEDLLAADSLEVEAPGIGTQGEDTPLTLSPRGHPAADEEVPAGERRSVPAGEHILQRLWPAVSSDFGRCRLHEDVNRRSREEGASRSSSSQMPHSWSIMTEDTRSAAPRARNSQWFSWHADRGPLNWAAQMAMVQFTLIEEGALSTGSSESASSSTGCGSPAQTSPFNLNERD